MISPFFILYARVLQGQEITDPDPALTKAISNCEDVEIKSLSRDTGPAHLVHCPIRTKSAKIN